MGRTFTEEQVKNLIRSNLNLKQEVEKMKDKLSKEVKRREEAEKKYADLCEGCIKLYIAKDSIPIDTITVRVDAPRFMRDFDFEKGLAESIVKLACARRQTEQVFRFR